MSAVAPDDPKHGPSRTMPRITRQATRALSAAGIDLPHDASAGKFGPVGSLLDDTDELMPDSALETGIAANYLEIGVTDARQSYSNESFALTRWNGDVFDG